MLKLTEKLWWFRYFSAIGVAVLCTYLGVQNPVFQNIEVAFPIAILVYIFTYFVAKYIWKIKPEQLPKKRDLALYGVFAYFIAWFVFWILFYTLAIKFFGI
ncbi:hypothetical protein DRO26_04850 [Candidatus Bathyarchaeota archaeon]|nr:MAG: hypothetical protein DRO26_04850 [Candidatus Bathyarchaeota archaeon]